MTGTRLMRGVLLGLALLVVVAVVWSLRRPSTPAASQSIVVQTSGNQMGGVRYTKYKDGVESFVLEAAKMTGSEQATVHLYGVRMTSTYLASGRQGKMAVTGETCDYTAELQKAIFQGRVVVTTDDGFELKTESLTYRGDKGFARSEEPVEFRRKELSGTSKGVVYEAQQGIVRLLDQAYVKVDDDKGGPPAEVWSREAVGNRDDGLVIFTDNVRLTRGPDTLTADELVLSFDTTRRILVVAQASGSVDLERAAGAPLPGMASGKGPKSLKCAKLIMGFRPDKTPMDATAGGGAEAVTLPGPEEVQERRDLKARALLFAFDEKGRLNELRGQKEVAFRAEGVGKNKDAPVRTLSCNAFSAKINPDTGETEEAEFVKDVVFTRGPQRATAQNGLYVGRHGILNLRRGPELADTEKGSSLTAEAIDLDTRNGDIAARSSVRNVLERKPSSGQHAGLLSRTENPIVLACASFSQVSKTQTTECHENALLRSDRDEIRAGAITIVQRPDGKQKMTATPRVESLLHPRPKPGEKPPNVVEGRSREMVYDEARNEIVYSGDVVIRQGDITSKSPEAILTLTPDGGTIQTIVAGEPVEMHQHLGPHSERVARGRRGTYLPAAQTMVLVGENATVSGPNQELRGRSLTFHAGDDTILVDGREETRTEAVLRREAPKP